MECMSVSGLSPLVTEYTEKQKKLIEECDLVISREGIELYVNENLHDTGSVVSCDIEHDECGNLVGIGLCNGGRCWYYTRITDELRNKCESLLFVMHNGVSDIECLRMWGIHARDEQLVWDTLLVGHILDSSLKAYGLKDMAKRELGIIYPSYDDIVGKRGLKAERVLLDKQPIELVSKYNALDCFVTWKLYERQNKAIGKS